MCSRSFRPLCCVSKSANVHGLQISASSRLLTFRPLCFSDASSARTFHSFHLNAPLDSQYICATITNPAHTSSCSTILVDNTSPNLKLDACCLPSTPVPTTTISRIANITFDPTLYLTQNSRAGPQKWKSSWNTFACLTNIAHSVEEA